MAAASVSVSATVSVSVYQARRARPAVALDLGRRHRDSQPRRQQRPHCCAGEALLGVVAEGDHGTQSTPRRRVLNARGLQAKLMFPALLGRRPTVGQQALTCLSGFESLRPSQIESS